LTHRREKRINKVLAESQRRDPGERGGPIEAKGKIMTQHESILATYGAMFDGGSDNSRRDIAADWADRYSPEEMAEWLAAGCWDPSSATILDDAGFLPGVDELAYRPGCERDDMDAMYALCNGDTGLKNLTW
jgi:hypothetical protein